MSSFDRELEEELEKLRKKKQKDTVTPETSRPKSFDEQLELELEHFRKYGTNTEEGRKTYLPSSINGYTTSGARSFLTDDIVHTGSKDFLNIFGKTKTERKLDSLLAVTGSKDFLEKSGYVSTKSDRAWDKLSSKYGMGYTDLQYEYINNQNGIRDEISQRAMSWGSDSGKTSSSYEEKALDFMTADEIAVYNYYYQTGGKDKAQEFLDVLAETLNARKAGKTFTNMEGKTAREILYGIPAGTEQFKQGVKNLGNMIVGKDDYIPQTSTQILGGMVREDLADDGFNVLGNSVGQMAFDVLNTGANMAPSIVVGALNPVAGAALMGGSASGNAYQQVLNEGHDKNSARLYASIIGTLEGSLQYALGGIGKLGGTSAKLAQAVSGIENAALRFALEYSGKIGSEAIEEGLQEILDPLVKNAVLGTDEDVDWENAAYSALLGGIMGAGFGASEVSQNQRSNDEIAVVKKEVENRISEMEKDGKKLTSKEKAEIEAQVEEALERGEISLDTIEEVLGGDDFTALRDTVTKENEALAELAELYEGDELKAHADSLLKDSKRGELQEKLHTSVFEKAKGSRLGESYRHLNKFQADLTKYSEKEQAIVKKAVDSGVLNDSRKTHEFVDFVAKVSSYSGIDFEFTNNQRLKETGFVFNGNTTNGFYDPATNKVVINSQAKKYLHSLVGHEVTHALEGSGLYESVEKIAFEYAKQTKEYKTRLKAAHDMYSGKEGYTGQDGLAKIKKEAVADMIGDYLFTDSKFVSHLSVSNPNVFQRIYNEVKHLWKLATAGSQQAKQLEQLKYTFEKALRENAKNTADGGVDYSIERTKSMNWSEQIEGALYGGKNIRRSDTLVVGNPADTSVANEIENKPLAIPLSILTKASSGKDISHSIKRGKLAKLDEGIKNAPITIVNPDRNAIVYVTNIKQGGLPIIAAFDMNAVFDGDQVHKATSIHLQVDTKSMLENLPESATIYVQKNELDPVGATNNLRGLAAKIKFIEGTITQQQENVKYSLSDSAGRNLSKEQQKFFKDSAVRDENGNLKVMYHGTSRGGHTMFDPYGKAKYGLFGLGSYFTDSKEVAQSYTKKGKGTSPQVYETYLNIKSPMDMDAAADPKQWQKAFPDAKFPESGTNEQFYRAMEEYFEDNEYVSWEAEEAAMDAIMGMGYDGITHIGGGRFNKADDTRHRVYIAFQPEQIKDVGNTKPTDDPDIRFSLSEDSDGNKLTEEQERYFRSSRMRDDNGNLKVMYHGTTDGGFHTFDTDYSDDGTSLFFVDRNDVAESYSGTGETYAAQTFKTAEDFNKFFAQIGAEEYEVREKDGKFYLYEDGDEAAVSDSAAEIYEEFRDWSGLGYGNVNYKVYLDLVNPLEVDAQGKSWNELPGVDGKSEQYAYIKIVEVGDGLNEVTVEYAMKGDPAPVTETVDLYKRFPDSLADTLSNMGPGEMLEGAYANPATTREYAQYARENGYDGVIFKNILDIGAYGGTNAKSTVAIAFDGSQVKSVANEKPTTNKDIRYSLSEDTNKKLNNVGLQYDSKSGTISYSMTSLEDAFDYNKSEADYIAARLEYEVALAKSIAVDKNNVTKEEQAKAKRYLDSLFLIHDMIAMDRDRLDYESAVGRSAWVSNAEYGGSVDFSTLCAKRRLFTGTFDAIQNELPDTVLNENDFLQIRNMLLAKELDSPCSMCYVEGSRAKHGVYVAKFLKEYLKSDPEWKPRIADFTSTTRLEQTRIQHPEAYKAYQDAMNALNQRKPKEASVRTDYKGEILRDFKDSSTIAMKNRNGGVRFNSFSDFEIIHAIDCMQVITDMARVGLNGQAYTKVKEFAEAFGNTGLKINLSLVAKDVDKNGKLVMDEVNGMKYAEAMDLRDRYSDNVGTVIVVFNEAQLKAALADSSIDYVLPFHRSQWNKSQYTMMGLPTNTKDFTSAQNDRIRNPKTGRYVKLAKIKHVAEYINEMTGERFEIKDNIMPNQYWDFDLSGRENAQRYLDYINGNGLVPKFNFLLSQENGKWVLPNDAVGDGYFKLLIDFKMYNNQGWGSPQNPVVPEFNMPYIQKMLDDYKGGHKAFPVAHDVVKEFVEGKKNHSFSLSRDTGKKYGDLHLTSEEIRYNPERKSKYDLPIRQDIAPVAPAVQEAPRYSIEEMFPDDLAPVQQELSGLLERRDELEAQMLEAGGREDFDTFYKLNEEYTAVNDRIEELDSEERAADEGRLASLEDADAPPEMSVTRDSLDSDNDVPDPMRGRLRDTEDFKTAKPFMAERPEVKPFFQDAARAMLGDVGETIRGERLYSEEAFMREGNEAAWTGVSRQTTADIAELRDNYGYSYNQIENALKAIIEDRVTERHLAAKNIEFMLNDRLLNGYTDMWGEPMPANQEYIQLAWEMSANDSRQDSFDSYMESVEGNLPPEAIGPVAEQKVYKAEPIKQKQDIGPVKEKYEAITPKKQPRMVKAAPEAEKIAKILDAEPTPQNKKNRAWARFKANVLDKGAVFEDLSLKTRNRELMGKWNFILGSEARAQRLMGTGTEEVKSLNAIREEVESSGKAKQFYDYLYHKHNVDRMQLEERYEDMENKPVFGYSVTAEKSQVIVDKYEISHPSFKQYAQDIYDYMNHLRKLMVDNGVISQDTADLWADMYPNYVPIRRAGKNGAAVNVPLDTGRTGVNAPVKKATGGNMDILPLFDTMALRTVQTYKAIAKNSFGVELKNVLGTIVEHEETNVDGMIDSVEQQEGLLQEGKNGAAPTFTVFENGEKVTFEITEDMYDALKPVSEGLAYTNKVANTISNFHRGLLTEYNPVFMLTNAIKDTQDILINSQHPGRTYLKLGEAYAQMLKKGYWYTEYMENGGEQNTYFDDREISFDTERKGVSKLLDIPPISTIGKLNNFIEMTPRLAEYIASREAGRSIEVSMLDAARVTTNFQAGGDLTKFLNRNGATFLNASVQGLMQNVRNFREAKANGWKGWANLATKFAVAGLPAVLLNGLLWDDDEEYEELSDYVKQNYYIVAKYGDGKFVRIPKGRTIAVIQAGIEQIGNAVTGDDEVDLNSFLELVVSNLAPNNPIEDNILAPIIQAKNNETWYGEDLVPTRLQDLPAAEQYDESTDKFSKWLGEKLDISPVKINYLLDQYTGGVGDTILPMLTPEAESGDNSAVGNLLAPLKSKFTTDSVMNNQNVSDFYDTKDELTTAAKSAKATDTDVLKNKYMNSVNADLSELYKQKREIQNSSLPDSVKYQRVRAIQQQIVDLTKESLDAYDNITMKGDIAIIGNRYFERDDEGQWQKMSDSQVAKYKATSAAGDAAYATDGTNHYRWYEPGEDSDGEPGWRKVSDKELERQNEVTSGLGITPEEYWAKQEEYSYAYDHPENYAVAKSVGGYEAYRTYSSELYEIKADKDENGKSISGSRKDKVIDYVSNLDIDYGMKLILFKSEYNADDTYNNEIIDYLNSRSDLSFDDIATILRKIGFEVSKDGTITW